MLEPAREPLPPEPVDPAIAAAIEAFRKPPPRGFADYLPIVIVLGILLVGNSGLPVIVSVLAVMVLRDLVRFALMKAMDAPEPDLLLLPLLKTVPDHAVPAWKEGVVVLGGLAVMLLTSLAALLVFVATKSPLAQQVIFASVGLTLFTLLPLFPYDGWRLLNLTLFSRSNAVEIIVVLLTALGMVLLAVALKAWVLILFGVLSIFSVPFLNKVARLAEALSHKGFPPPPLDDAAVLELAQAVHRTWPPAPQAKPAMVAKLQATYMRRVSKKVHTRPPGMGATLALLLGYVATFVYLVATIAFASAAGASD